MCDNYFRAINIAMETTERSSTIMTNHLLDVNSLVLHGLPLWFLVFSLFLPRIALIIAWFDRDLVRFHLDNILAPILALLLPRVLILVLIYKDQGLSMWFLIHLIVALMVWSGTGGRHMVVRGRRRSDL